MSIIKNKNLNVFLVKNPENTSQQVEKKNTYFRKQSRIWEPWFKSEFIKKIVTKLFLFFFLLLLTGDSDGAFLSFS